MGYGKKLALLRISLGEEPVTDDLPGH